MLQLTSKREHSNGRLMDVGSLVAFNRDLRERSLSKHPAFRSNRTPNTDISKQPTAESVDEVQPVRPKKLLTEPTLQSTDSKCCHDCGDKPPTQPKKVAMPKRLPNLRCLAIEKRPIRIVTPRDFNEKLEREESVRHASTLQSKASDLTRTKHN